MYLINIFFILVIFCLSSPTFAQEKNNTSKLNEEEITKLIEELPTATALGESKRIIYNDKLKEDAKKEAKETIDKAKEIVPKLKASIKVNDSIFKYKGLLSKGRVSYSKDFNEYSLYIGVYLRQHEGTQEFDFRVIFDEKGTIKEVKKVIWKR